MNDMSESSAVPPGGAPPAPATNATEVKNTEISAQDRYVFLFGIVWILF